MPLITALEGAGWTLEELRHGKWLTLATRATVESMRVVAAQLGASLPWTRFFVQPWIIRLATLVAPLVVPFDVERYLRYHFTKVGDQSRLLMQGMYEGARQQGVEAPALTELNERVFG